MILRRKKKIVKIVTSLSSTRTVQKGNKIEILCWSALRRCSCVAVRLRMLNMNYHDDVVKIRNRTKVRVQTLKKGSETKEWTRSEGGMEREA